MGITVSVFTACGDMDKSNDDYEADGNYQTTAAGMPETGANAMPENGIMYDKKACGDCEALYLQEPG